MENSTILGAVALALSVIGTIIGVLNRKRIRSNCCGKKLEASVVIDTIAPSPQVAPAKSPTIVV